MDLLEGADAWRKVHDPQVAGGLNMDGVLELMLAAGYSEDQAQREATRRGMDRQREGKTP